MAELRRATPTVVAVLASAEAIDRLAPSPGATLCRVAPREAMLVGAVDPAAVDPGEPDAIVEDVSDGWTAFELSGEGVADAFARLSELELPDDGSVQGEVARVGAKVLVAPARVTILVPAMLGAFVEERIRTDCAEVLR